MHLTRVELLRAPGTTCPLVLDGLPPGLVLVVGPNASGKSTLRRALLASLWPDGVRGVELVGVWRHGGRTLRVSLRDGQAEWSEPPPPLPDVASSCVLTIQDLLRAGGADAAIARAVRVELSGGYDLHAARAAFAPLGRAPRPLVQAVKQARAALARAERDVEALAGEEEALRALREEAAAARDASARLPRVDLAEELLEVRRRRDRAASEREALPRGAASVEGGELQRFDELAEEERAALDRADRARHALGAASRRLGELTLPAPEPTPAGLDAWRARVEALRQVAGRVEQAARDAAAAGAKARALEAGVFGEVGLGGPVDVALLDALDELSDRHRTLVAAERAGHAAARWLEELLESLPSEDPEAWAARARALRAWLASYEVAPDPVPWTGGSVWGLVGIGALLVLAGAVLSAWVAALGALLLGLGVGVCVAGRPAEAVRVARRRIEAEVARAGEGSPAWREDAVRAELAEVERRLADARLAERTRPRLDAAHREARSHREEVARLAAEVARRAGALGLAPDLVGLPLSVQVRRIVQLVEARAERDERRQRQLGLERELAEALARFGNLLEGFGLPRCRDVAEAGAGVEALAARVAELRQLREEETRQAETLREAEERARTVRARREALLGRVGVPDREALAEAIRHRVRHAELTDAIRTCDARMAEIAPRIGELAALDAAALADLRADLEARAERYEGLVERIKSIEVAIEAARGGRTLEEARAARVEAEAALVAARDASWEEAVACWLADLVEGERTDAHAPPVLRRARGWFARFTRGAFELELGDEGFTARDTRTGEPRALHELSDATRIQLLLAARVAHVEALERGGPRLPLFLDEVLSTTDPARFRAIAGALLELAAGGRQLVYFTADLDEAAAWTEACRALGQPVPRVYDLGDGGSVRPPAELPAPPRTPVPSPHEHDAESYARVLGVRAPDGFRAATAWELWYLLRDDLGALHRCLLAGIATVGQWRSLAHHGAEALGPDLDARLRRRSSLLERLLERWRSGRSRPLAWEDLVGAGAVTPAYEEELRRLLAEHGRDARAFLAAVAELPRFRRRRIEQLEARWREVGLIPDEAPVPPAILEADMAVEAAVLGEPDAAWVQWLVRAVCATGAGAPGSSPPIGATDPAPTALT